MKTAVVTLFLGAGVSAFVPSSFSINTKTTKSSLNAVNWTPKEDEFAYGLPGSLSPVPEFDPFGFATDADLNTMKKYREAESTHGRVAMLAFIGLLITEQPFEFHPLFEVGGKDIGPAIRHLDEVRATAPAFFEILVTIIGAAEFGRALSGWRGPETEEETGKLGPFLREEYYPGDVGFDPLGLKPEDEEEFFAMSTKELQHGRVAMLAVAGIVAQELTNGKEIFVNLGLAPDKFDPSSLPIQF